MNAVRDESNHRAGTTVADRSASHTRRLCDTFLELLGVDGVSVAVRSGRDNAQLVHATDPVIAQLDELQFTLGEGPCLDAYRTRSPMLVPDLASGAAFSRWPGFAHEAADAGASAVFAFPLQIGSVPFGTVELYRARPGPLPEHDTATALLVVDELVRAVLDELTGDDTAAAATKKPAPLFGRPEVAVATGMVAVQLGVSVPEALAQLRAAAFAEFRPIVGIAQDVIARRRRFNPDHD